MKLKDIYRAAIELGIDKDPRGRAGVEAELSELRKAYDNMTDVQKVAFNTERLENPYADSMILHGDPDMEVKSVMVGIDIETGEIVLADRLREKRGGHPNLVFAHHPEGRALAGFYNVMFMQADILNRAGVPINIGEHLIQERHTEVERGIMPINHTRTV
ncbi:NGG1p interacting factor NIF3, partial [bacterium]|nr:NGG1p interacting factor NIF3 [bacterium]